ncbi:MAG: uroporphyrinogen-III synthase [Gammaproteobacteria bacterium]|jgi:uroporphyrinogen-III synthase
MSGPLANCRIALAECGELDLLARMLEREGAEAVRCPLVAICDAPDSALLKAWIRRVIAGECDDLILYRGNDIIEPLGVGRTTCYRHSSPHRVHELRHHQEP